MFLIAEAGLSFLYVITLEHHAVLCQFNPVRLAHNDKKYSTECQQTNSQSHTLIIQMNEYNGKYKACIISVKLGCQKMNLKKLL